MLLDDFRFDLPEELIAQYPSPRRDQSRLLMLDGATGEYVDQTFTQLVGLINPGDLLIFNDTRVIPARLFGRKPTGGRVEIVIERLLDDRHCLAQIRAGKAPKEGSRIVIADKTELEVTGRCQGFFVLRSLPDQALTDILQAQGHTPLPPYIKRPGEPLDAHRYQTVYAREDGAVAAPTAGLHFTDALIAEIERKGARCVYVTLHVGAGTFRPVRDEVIENHQIHSERCEVSEQVCEHIRKTKKAGNRIIAVGTTSVRSLEAASVTGDIEPFRGETDIYIYPGFQFQTVDAMITNFHLPASTLFILVCAFAGYEKTMRAYEHAIAEKYRFFSYGDAMFITREAVI